MHCSGCGNPVDSGSSFCPSCGKSTAVSQSGGNAATKGKTLRSVLWWATAVGAGLGALTLVIGVASADGAPQEASAAAISVGLAVIPYCFARAVSKIILGD